MIEADIHGVYIIDTDQAEMPEGSPMVFLKARSQDRFLAIWIAPHEAGEIENRSQPLKFDRPKTHELMARLIERLGGRLVSVRIVDAHEEQSCPDDC